MPIATKKSGFIAFAFPDVCKTQVGPAQVPIPYPNIGQLSDAKKAADSSTGTGEVKAGGDLVILAQASEIQNTLGDQAGAIGGVKSGTTGGKVTFTSGSKTVKVHGKEVVRMMDPTSQNDDNAVGFVLGGVTNVMAGG